MDERERLAAYLVGELEEPERLELESRLRQDSTLRARLDRIREVDDALEAMGDVPVPAEFSTAMRASLVEEIGRQHTGLAGDELSRRRSQRLRTWAPAIGAAAALVALFAAVLTSLPNFGADDTGAEDGGMATMETADAGEDTAVEEAEEAAEAEAGTAMVAPGPPGQPVIVSRGSAYDQESVRSLADDPALDTGPFADLSDEAAGALTAEYRAALGVDVIAPTQGDAPEVAADEPAEADGDLPTAFRGDELSGVDIESIERCLPVVLEGTELIPVYVELAEYEGEEAIVFGLIGRDEATQRYERIELWVVSRSDCQARLLTR